MQIEIANLNYDLKRSFIYNSSLHHFKELVKTLWSLIQNNEWNRGLTTGWSPVLWSLIIARIPRSATLTNELPYGTTTLIFVLSKMYNVHLCIYTNTDHTSINFICIPKSNFISQVFIILRKHHKVYSRQMLSLMLENYDKSTLRKSLCVFRPSKVFLDG